MGKNVTDAVQPPRAIRVERSAWTREQTRRFLAVAKESHYGPIWLLMATTGMRRGEVLGLRWASVDLDAGMIDIRQTLVAVDGRMKEAGPKGGKRHTIPLPAEMGALLHAHRARQDTWRAELGDVWVDNDLVFPSEVGTPINARNLDREFKRFIARVGVPEIPIHSIRHTVGTLLVASGEAVRTVAETDGNLPKTVW